MIKKRISIIGTGVWSIWRMLWVDWCQFTYIFDEQLSKFRVDTRLVEWSLILMIVTVQIYDNFMFLYHWKGCLIDWTDGVSRLISMELHFAFSVLAKNLRISPKPSLRVAVQSVIDLKLFETLFLWYANGTRRVGRSNTRPRNNNCWLARDATSNHHRRAKQPINEDQMKIRQNFNSGQTPSNEFNFFGVC